jgi:hypothetical protein
MIEIGFYDIALLPGTDEAAFVARMAELGDGTGVVQLTRVTVGFEARLLRRDGTPTIYAWMLTARLMTSVGYDFGQNVDRLQEAIKDVGIVVGVEHYFVVAPTE